MSQSSAAPLSSRPTPRWTRTAVNPRGRTVLSTDIRGRVDFNSCFIKDVNTINESNNQVIHHGVIFGSEPFQSTEVSQTPVRTDLIAAHMALTITGFGTAEAFSGDKNSVYGTVKFIRFEEILPGVMGMVHTASEPAQIRLKLDSQSYPSRLVTMFTTSGHHDPKVIPFDLKVGDTEVVHLSGTFARRFVVNDQGDDQGGDLIQVNNDRTSYIVDGGKTYPNVATW